MGQRSHWPCSQLSGLVQSLSQVEHCRALPQPAQGQRIPAEWSGCDDECADGDVAKEAGPEGVRC